MERVWYLSGILVLDTYQVLCHWLDLHVTSTNILPTQNLRVLLLGKKPLVGHDIYLAGLLS